MSKNYKKMTDAYQTTERNALVETEDPHQLVLVMFDDLLLFVVMRKIGVAVNRGCI